MKLRETLVAMTALVLSFSLVGCSGGQQSERADSSPNSTNSPVPSESTDKKPNKTESSDSAKTLHVVADSYEFDIPKYWENRVRVAVSGNDVSVVSAKYPTFQICRLYVSDTVHSLGDIGNSMIGKLNLSDGRVVQLWITRWGFVAGNAELNGTSGKDTPTEEQAEELVDLQTGGSTSYSAVKQEMAQSAEHSSALVFSVDTYLNKVLVPTLRVR